MFDFSQVGPIMPRVPEPEHNKLRDILGNAAHDHIGEFGAGSSVSNAYDSCLAEETPYVPVYGGR